MTWKNTDQELPKIIPNKVPRRVGASHPVLAYRDGRYGVWRLVEDYGWRNSSGAGVLPPSHWMPLPEAPEQISHAGTG